VTPITTATNKPGKPINAGTSPVRILMAPSGQIVYVLDSPALPIVGTPATTNDGSVIPIATATNKAGKAVSVGLGPTGFAITPNGSAIYVANATSDTVTPISTATSKAGTAIPVGQDPTSIAITP
jgi:YVTN family beta-propeller protein